jgi:serine/threonine protein phosphatase 1
MRKFFISDIHGAFNEMVLLLREAQFDPSVDQIVFGGDLIDRGPDSGRVIRLVKNMQQMYPNNVKAILGNHEHAMGMYLAEQGDMWENIGGVEAMDSFNNEFETQEDLEEHLLWAVRLPELEQDDEYVYVHAGLIPGVPLEEQKRIELVWMPYSPSQARFSRDFTVVDILHTTGNRKVVHGHTPKSYVFDDGARIGCDLGAVVKSSGGKLALVNLTDGMYWYYDFDTNEIKDRKIAGNK